MRIQLPVIGCQLPVLIKLTGVILLTTIFISQNANAQSGAVAFLDLNAGARGMGMGNATVALADDGFGAFANPAGLSQLHSFYITSQITNQFGVNNNTTAMVIPLGLLGTMGISALYNGLDNIPGTAVDAGNNVYYTGSNYSYRAQSLMASYAFSFMEFLAIGVNIKSLKEQIVTDFGTAIAADAGVLITPPGPFSLGIMAENIFSTPMQWTTGTREKLSQRLHTGVALKLFNKVTLSLEGVTQEQRPMAGRLGAEFWILGSTQRVENDVLGFAVRGGLIGSTQKDANAAQYDTTLGLGIRYYELSLDYAYLQSRYEELGAANRISLGIRL